MGNKQINESLSYKIGYIIGKAIIGWLKILWIGLFKQERIVINTYIAMAIMGITTTILFEYQASMVIYSIIYVTFNGLVVYFADEYPVKKRRKFFNSIFEEIKLKYNDNIPYYIIEKVISEYVICYSFRSFIPLNEWQSKKVLIELHLNEKVLDIKQDTNDYRITHIVVQKEPLPSQIEWDNKYLDDKNNVLNMGNGMYGLVGMDLQKHPHALIGGETGSGKSNILKCMIHQALMKHYEVILIDFKRGVSFASFSDVVDIYYEYDTAMEVLKKMVEETNRRLNLFRTYKVEKLQDYNKLAINKMRRKIIFIDELAELLKTRDKEISNSLYDSLETLTRLSRAVGIHLIIGIQRPDSTIVNGQIKNNISFRVCGRFVDKEPSRIMLNCDMASKLENIKGRFIVKDNEINEIQAFYFSDNISHINIENVLNKNNIINIEDILNKNEIIESEDISNKNGFKGLDIINHETNKKDTEIEDTKIQNELIFDFRDIK